MSAVPPPILYVVITPHLDTQWRWTVRDTIRRFLPATLRENFAIGARVQGHAPSFEGAFRYMLIREYYPREFERLKSEVRAGRWHPAGGMLDAPDVNVVAPESLIRHLLYGGRFFARELGVESRDVFLPDCFGFGHALPSVAAHCGIAGFSSQKFINWMPPAETPFETGYWQGPDGAGVVAVLNPGGYGEGLREDLSRSSYWQDRIERLAARAGIHAEVAYVGVGDKGGGLGRRSVRWLRRSVRGKGPVRVRIAASDRFFRDLTSEQIARLPRHRGELLLPTHGTGCWTSQTVLKRWNRRNELLADAAERAAVAAELVAAVPYPREVLESAWLRFLWHQMHDDLTGTSIPEAYEISWNDELLSHNQLSTVLADSVGAVARALDTRGSGIPLVVFNPLCAPRRDVVQARLRLDPASIRGLVAIAPDGRELPCQIECLEGDLHRVLFAPELPPVGFAVFDLRAERAPATEDPRLAVSAGRLESERYRLELDKRGDIGSLFDKRLGRELLSAPAGLVLLPDRSDRWPAWEIRYEDVGAAGHRVDAAREIAVVEAGPVRAALEVRRRSRGSRYVQRLRLAAGEAGSRLEVDTRIEWATRGRLLKAVFPFAAANPVATYDLGLGVIERGNNSRQRYEVPAQQWADLTAADGSHGVAVLNDSRYGWDKPDDATLRLTLLRSPRTGRRFRHQGTQDFGSHRTLYALHGHAGDWRDGEVPAAAARLNQAPLAFTTTSHPGPLGRSYSLVRRDGKSALVRAVKKAEEGEETVVRLHEARGEPGGALRLRAGGRIVAARELDGVERTRGDATLEDGALVTRLGPFQPRTYALSLAPPAAPPPLPVSSVVELPYDLVAASFHERPGPGAFDGAGHAYPGELLPAGLAAGGVELRLGPRRSGAPNALVCRGQSIHLPEGAWDEAWLLAAAVGGDVEAGVMAGGRRLPLRVQDWTEPIGVWRHTRRAPLAWWRRRPVPGYLKPDAVAWVGTHRHARGARDEPYVFCYLFRYRLELPPGTASLRLPSEARVRLFALTVVRGAGVARSAWPG